MDCYFSGIIGLALLGGSVLTLSVTEQQHNLLKNVFSDDLDKKYEKIINERRNHYIIGLIIGMIISYVIINNKLTANNFTRLALSFTITLTIALVFYMLMPKSDYMLNHLKTPEENKKWLEVYKTMKKRYFLGFVLGSLAAIPIVNTFC